MRRRDLLVAIGSAAATLRPLNMRAQQQRGIGVLVPGSQNDPVWRDRYGIILNRLHELGWRNGDNLAVQWRFAGADFDSLPLLATELVQTRPAAILVNSAGLANIVHSVTRAVPVIVAGAGDLEGTRLVEDLHRPGGNVTGTQTLNPDLMGKRIELIAQLVGDLRRLGVVEPLTPTAIITEHYIQVISETGAALGIQIHRIPVRRPEEFDPAFSAIARAGDGAALVITNPLSLSNRQQVVGAAARNMVPAIYESRPFVTDGGLVSYSPDIVELYQGAADLVDKVLKGANPADLPVEQPTKFELVINLKTAKALGLTVPQSVLARADEVIE